jgi:RNA polymerase sigma-70 factor (ECF subfamily)
MFRPSFIIPSRVAIDDGAWGMDEPPETAAGARVGAETSIELAQRARGGDRTAFDELFRRYAPALRRWAAGRLPRWARDIVDTEDMVQETMLRTFSNLEAFEPQGHGALHAYMRQALRNRISDEVRRSHRRPRPTDLTVDVKADAASPLEETIGSQALDRYEQALSRLPEQDREAVVARVEMDLGYEEIARALGKPSADAARMAVSRALVRLAREMGHARES